MAILVISKGKIIEKTKSFKTKKEK